MAAALARLLGVHRMPRVRGVPDRTVVLAMGARFLDELLSGVLVVAMPTIRSRLGLGVAQVGLAFQVLSVVAAIAEPAVGTAIDLTRRRPLLVFGAAGSAVAAALVAGAGSAGWLLLAFAVYGLASGPLVLTGDVVLIEAHPEATERISARADLVDTVGALLAPVAVGAAAWAALDERWVLAAVAVLGAALALALRSAALPAPAPRPAGEAVTAAVRGNLGAVLRSASARRWLGVLVVVEAVDTAALFAPVWLHDEVGMSQGLVAVHVAVELVTALAVLALLDGVLARADPVRVLRVAALASVATGALWLLVGGPVAKLALAVPHAAAVAPLWPIARARALAAEPGRAGTVSGLLALTGLLPVAAVVGWAGAAVGLAPALLAVHAAGAVAVLLLAPTPGRRRRAAAGGPPSPPPGR